MPGPLVLRGCGPQKGLAYVRGHFLTPSCSSCSSSACRRFGWNYLNDCDIDLTAVLGQLADGFTGGGDTVLYELFLQVSVGVCSVWMGPCTSCSCRCVWGGPGAVCVGVRCVGVSVCCGWVCGVLGTERGEEG